jgi:hypothetical protein
VAASTSSGSAHPEPWRSTGSPARLLSRRYCLLVASEPVVEHRGTIVILDVVDLDEPPPRLLRVSYALARAADIIERQSAEDRKWAFLSERTDFQEVAAQ